MSVDYDVVVVGARVAGAPTAMLLARRGHRVLLIDRATMPSDTVSTHAILRTGTFQLQRWGLLDKLIEAGTPPINDIVLGFGEERVRFRVRPEFGVTSFYGPRRHVLDSLLVDAAVEAGAEFQGGTRMTGLLRGPGDEIRGVEIDDRHPVTARIVVGADGVHSRVATLVGSKSYRSHEATNAVSYAYYENVPFPGFWFQFSPGVNAGLIATNDDQCLAFVGRPTRELKRFRGDPEGEFSRLLRLGGTDLADHVEEGRRVGGFRGTPGLPGFIRQSWGSGWVLVGDAGYTKDPISAHGISDALRDAELCARALDRFLTDRDPQALAWYQSIRDRLSARMFEESRSLASYRWSPDQASQRMRRISEAVRHECHALEKLPEWSAAGASSGVSR